MVERNTTKRTRSCGHLVTDTEERSEEEEEEEAVIDSKEEGEAEREEVRTKLEVTQDENLHFELTSKTRTRGKTKSEATCLLWFQKC